MKNEKQEKWTKLMRLAFTLLFLFTVCAADVYAQGQIQAKLNQSYTWIKGIVNAVLGILVLIKVGQVVYKAFFQHREFGMDLGMALIGVLIWALFNVFANDILSMFGVQYTLQ